MADVLTCLEQYRSYVQNTYDHRAAAELARDYFDGKQWSSANAAVLRNRRQAPIVKNRIGPKVDFLVGMEQKTRTDPVALPRGGAKHEQGAEAATDALRYLEEVNRLDGTLSKSFQELCIEGIEAVFVPIEQKRGQAMPVVHHIPWDRFYYDPMSRRDDFEDATFFGLTVWLNRGTAKRMFKDANFDHIEENSETAHEDRPSIAWSTKERVRVNYHCYLGDDGKWYVCYFCGTNLLMPIRPSPYIDEDGNPSCPILAQCLYVDRENNRYGPVARLIDSQDEINHRSSKALHMLSSNRMWANKGVFANKEAALDELQKGRGFVEPDGGGPGAQKGVDWDIISNAELAQGQLLMMQDAKQEIDAIGANAALTGKDDRDLSGRAQQLRGQSGAVELGRLFEAHREFKVRIYRALWMRVRQFWSEETWIRVTDDERNVRFVGLNRKVTHGEKLQQQGIQPIDGNDPQLNMVVGIENNVEDMDVDITIETAPDTMSLQQEQFEVMASLAQGRPELFEAVLELSTLRNKQQIIEKYLRGGDDPQRQAALQKQAAMVEESAMAKVQKDKAAAIKDVSVAALNQAKAQGAIV